MKCYKPGSGDFTASGFSSPQSLHRDHHDQRGCDDDGQDA